MKRALIFFLVFFLVACSKPVELVSGLSESEANEILGTLLKSSISAKKVARKDGIYIEVDSEHVGVAIEILRNLGLPRQRHSRLGDVFKKENLISSPLEERARYLYALSQELEQTISQIDGVIAVRVHVALSERLGPGEPTTPSSASVFIKHQHDSAVETTVAQIRDLVFNSIPGLTQEKISVVLVPAQAGSMSGGVSQLEDVWIFRVDRQSVFALRLLLASTLILAVISTILMLITMTRTNFTSTDPIKTSQHWLSSKLRRNKNESSADTK